MMSRLFEEFRQYLTKMQQYDHVTNLLYWDMRTKAPKLGQAAHIEALTHFSAESFALSTSGELGEMLDMVNTLIQYSVNMFATGNESHMQDVISLEDKVDAKEKEMQKTHVQRLAKGECSPEVGMVFSDIVSGLERVADHATNIAFAIINAEKEAENAEE